MSIYALFIHFLMCGRSLIIEKLLETEFNKRVLMGLKIKITDTRNLN